jgi:hypothetical protein
MSEIGSGPIVIMSVIGTFIAYVGAIAAYNHFKVDSPASRNEGSKRSTRRSHRGGNRTRKA